MVSDANHPNRRVRSAGRVIDYPTPPSGGYRSESARRGWPRSGRAAARACRAFTVLWTARPSRQLEELYTATFDLKPVCYPYIGYQLFGDTYKRGRISGAPQRALSGEPDSPCSGELPDHLGVILRYLARTPDADLVAEGLVPYAASA